ncbi:MAG: DUF21 domain-containing protein [Pirellulales bacterium]|nr:DUF21 domain-containing protein [Pirellulales bacterium]
MIALVLVLAAGGLLLSAFFSGSETGFYRVVRVRLVLDALGGDAVARSLVWLANRPSLFVATSLVGNNVANYLVSLAIVMGMHLWFGPDRPVAEMAAPLLLAPVLFLYGELLPKNFFLHAPNRLLRLGGPLFGVFVVLFLPVSALLWGLNALIARLLGQSPERVRLALARRELERVLDEGHEAGIVHPAQQRLARGMFALATEPVSHAATPLADLPIAPGDADKDEVLRLARWHGMADVPIANPENDDAPAGYVRVFEAQLSPSETVGPIRPLLEIAASDTYLAALVRMENEGQTMAQVVDAEGRAVGLLSARRLRESLFRGQKTAGDPTCDSPAT